MKKKISTLMGMALLSFWFVSMIVPANADEALDPLMVGNSQFLNYRIGKGDILRVLVWKEPDLTMESVNVRLDGKITIPLIDDVQAEGLSPIELKKEIESRLSEFVESPLVTVILSNSASQKYYVLGEVENIGEYPIVKKLNVMQAFALAGGFTEWAAKKEIILYRAVGGEEKLIRINYKDIIKGKNFADNVVIRADDIIIVP